MTEVMRLPKLGVNMTEATIISWKVAEGESVIQGQPLFEAQTDKAVQEFESTITGVLEKILATPGTTVACQEPVAAFRIPQPSTRAQSDIQNTGEIPPEGNAPHAVPIRSMEHSTVEQESMTGTGRLRISPLARRTARTLGVEPSSVSPAKPGARIVKDDILAHYRQIHAEAEKDRTSVPLTGMRKTIASRMSQSVQETASAALTIRVNASNLLKWRDELKTRVASVNLSVLLAVVAARALERFPILNSTLTNEVIQIHEKINIGIAVDSERGLIVPVLRQANTRTVEELLSEFQQLIAAVQQASIKVEDLQDGTFTITNLGALGIESFTPIINPPQCAILAMGAITREILPADDREAIEVHPVVRLTLVFDHRIIDGAPAARFLQYVRELLERAAEGS
jgi:pyruvate dehydrogenase E2 component (dihydrolipoamide acetyltransferase)